MSNRTLNLTEDVYQYLLDHTAEETQQQRQLRQLTSQLEFANMQIAPEQGLFMAFLVKLLGIRMALEIGVFTGYSSLSVAQALPDDGKLVACDINREWTDIARQYWREAGVEDKIELHLADAKGTLHVLMNSGYRDQFDFAFIDADKGNYDAYYEACLELVRPGGLIMIDNTLWGGDVANVQVNDHDTQAIRRLNRKIREDRRVEYCMLPVADGLTLVRRT